MVTYTSLTGQRRAQMTHTSILNCYQLSALYIIQYIPRQNVFLQTVSWKTLQGGMSLHMEKKKKNR